MAWKRTTSKKRWKKNSAAGEMTVSCEMLTEYLEEMIIELNMRSLTEYRQWSDRGSEELLFPPVKLLWAESVSINEFCTPTPVTKQNRLKRLWTRFKEMLWHFFR